MSKSKLLISCLLIMIANLGHSFDILVPKVAKSIYLDQYNKDIIQKIYSEVGVKVNFLYLDEDEINKRIKEGHFDAIGSKITNESLIPNSDIIPYPLIEKFSIHLYTNNKSRIKKRDINVGIIKGDYSHQKTMISNRRMFSNVSSYSTNASLIKALEQNKVEAIFLSDLVYNVNFNDYNKNKLKMIHKDLSSFSMSHYLHSKHGTLKQKMLPIFKRYYLSKKLDYLLFVKNNFNNKKLVNLPE